MQTGQYNIMPCLKTRFVNFKSLSVAGANPIDSNYIQLPNIRGQLMITITQSDSPALVGSTFFVTGGFGQFPQESTLNWYASTQTTNCIVSESIINEIIVTTTAPAALRQFLFKFSFNQGFGCKVKQISINPLGVNDVTILLSKSFVVEGF